MYREEFPSCPACEGKLDPAGARLVCGSCGGVFVPQSQLADMFAEMSPDDARPFSERLLPREDADLARTCPKCSVPMNKAWLEQVAVDICSEHGVWFDANELAWVLETDGVAWANRNPSYRDQRERDRPPARAGVPEAPGLRRTFWQKFFGLYY